MEIPRRPRFHIVSGRKRTRGRSPKVGEATLLLPTLRSCELSTASPSTTQKQLCFPLFTCVLILRRHTCLRWRHRAGQSVEGQRTPSWRNRKGNTRFVPRRDSRVQFPRRRCRCIISQQRRHRWRYDFCWQQRRECRQIRM